MHVSAHCPYIFSENAPLTVELSVVRFRKKHRKALNNEVKFGSSTLLWVLC